MLALRVLALAAVLLTASAFAGCLQEAPSTGVPAREEAPAVEGNATAGSTLLEREFQGKIVRRLAGDGAPTADYDGDPYAFCVIVPENTTRLMGVLSWSPQEQMVLEFNGKDSRATTMQDDPVMGLADVQGLLELVLENPEPGTYQVYAGPGAAGAEIEWALKLTWEVARAGATVEETVHPNADACT